MTEFLTVDTSLPPYLIFPRFLLDMELNETTKLLYMILLDRARLSLRNEGWTDASGHVFLYFTIEAMANVLHKSQMTIKTSLAALESKGLILRKRQGAGHPNRIYVKFPKDAFRETDRKLSGNKKERVRRTALPMETFRMYSCQQKNWRTSGRPSNWQDYIERLSGYMKSFHWKAVPEPCSHHHQLGAAGQSPFPAKIL